MKNCTKAVLQREFTADKMQFKEMPLAYLVFEWLLGISLLIAAAMLDCKVQT